MSSKEDEIFSACENGTFKFALTSAQKLIKKFPKSTYHQILYNYVLLQSGKDEEAIQNCKEIFSKTPNDTKSLELLNSIFNDVGMPTEALQVYENAAKKYPSFEILTKWFHLGVETANYRVLQKSAMALKSFNASRTFGLWAAFTCQLAASAPDANAMERGLFPKLGLKIADSLKPMKSEQEVYVLVKLLELNGENGRIVEEILEFSQNDKLDLELQIILLKALDALEDWTGLYQWSETVLLTYKLDDFDTWKYLIKSSLKLNKDISEILSQYDSRNSLLAKVELQLQSSNDIHEPVFEYLTRMGTKNCAFFDIKHYIAHLDSSKLITWLESEEIPRGERGLTWEVNVTKFRVLLDRSLLQSPQFISDMVSKYNFYKPLLSNKSKTDFSNSSELILFIVQATLSQSPFNATTLLTCVAILEGAIIKDEHEFHLRLWLIQLYSLLQCHQQAQYHWDSLKIKNIQFDILNQYLSTRLAYSRPVVQVLEDGYDIYNSNDAETVYFTKVGFNKGAYNKLGGMIEFQTRLGKSYLKRHLALQGVKIGRLLNDKNLIQEYKSAALFEDVEWDNRDMKIFWNVGIDEELDFSSKLLENVTNASYNKIISIQEKLISGDIDSIPEDLKLDGLTAAEKWSFETVVSVNKFLKSGSDSKSVIEKYDLVDNLLSFSSNQEYCSWKTSHTIFVLIDTCKAVHSMFSKTKGKLKGSPEVRERNITLLNSLKDDKIMEIKAAAVSHVKNTKPAVERSETINELGFSSVVDSVFDIVTRGNTECFRLMAVL